MTLGPGLPYFLPPCSLRHLHHRAAAHSTCPAVKAERKCQLQPQNSFLSHSGTQKLFLAVPLYEGQVAEGLWASLLLSPGPVSMSVSQVRNYTAFPSRRPGWTWGSFENGQNLQPVLMLCGTLASGQHCSLGSESQRFTNNVIINQGKDLPFSLVLEAFKGLLSTPTSQAGGGVGESWNKV